MPVRGVRGATTIAANDREAIMDGTRELLQSLVQANGIKPEEVASVLFSMTADLNAAFPAAAARSLGWDHVALIDTLAPSIPSDLSRCIRVLVHWNTDRDASEIRHVYLHEATQLRPDLAHGG